MPRASAKSLEPFTIEVSASELPARILETFPKPSPPEARFAVTVEPAESEAEKLAALQRDLQAGLEDLAAGRVSDGEEVFTRLRHVSKTMIDGPGAVYGKRRARPR